MCRCFLLLNFKVSTKTCNNYPAPGIRLLPAYVYCAALRNKKCAAVKIATITFIDVCTYATSVDAVAVAVAAADATVFVYIILTVAFIVVTCIFVYTFVLSSLCLPVRCLASLWQQPCGETSFMFALCFSFYKVVVCSYLLLLLLLLLLLINYSQHFAVVVTDLLILPLLAVLFISSSANVVAIPHYLHECVCVCVCACALFVLS